MEMKNRFWLAALFITTMFCPFVNSEQNNTNTGKYYSNIPSVFALQMGALGDRVKTSGKETTIYIGEFTDADGKATATRVIYQLPGLVRLEGFKGQGTAISFNGKDVKGITSRQSDEALLETFVMDFPEGMLESIQESAAVRIIGRGFGPDPALVLDYKGPRYDLFEVTIPVRSRQDKTIRTKTYYYDSKTGYLQRTQYYDRSVKPPVKIETRFSMWGSIDGSAYPAVIEHYEGGKLVYSFTVTAIENVPALDASQF